MSFQRPAATQARCRSTEVVLPRGREDEIPHTFQPQSSLGVGYAPHYPRSRCHPVPQAFVNIFVFLWSALLRWWAAVILFFVDCVEVLGFTATPETEECVPSSRAGDPEGGRNCGGPVALMIICPVCHLSPGGKMESTAEERSPTLQHRNIVWTQDSFKSRAWSPTSGPILPHPHAQVHKFAAYSHALLLQGDPQQHQSNVSPALIYQSR